jgi:DNA adenine methylase
MANAEIEYPQDKELVRAILRYPGAKWRIADFILRHMPRHHSYLEPFFGSGAVLFRKAPAPIETINDINGDVVNLFRVVQTKAAALAEVVAGIPYARQAYEDSLQSNPEASDVDRAARFLTLVWQSYGTRADGGKCGWKKDIAGREAAYAMRNWNRLPSWIVAAAARLKQVQIEHRDALQLIRQFNHPKVLIYCDPPYMHVTRRCKSIYRREMDDEAHEELLDVLNKHCGSVMLSGYANELYDAHLHGWERYDTDMVITSGVKRTETLWVKQEA